MIDIRYKMSMLMIVWISILSISIQAAEIPPDPIIRVGVYEYEPYLMVDDDGEISGYYKDLMELTKKNYGIKYEFVVGTIKESLERLESHEIDVMLGVPLEAPVGEDIIFSQYSTNQEIFGVFSDEKITFESLYTMPGLIVGMVEDDFNANVIMDLFKAHDIDIQIRYEKNYKILESLLESGQIDLIIENKWKEREYCLVYEFIGRDVYVAGHEESRDVLDYFNRIADEVIHEDEELMNSLHAKYFDEEQYRHKNMMIGISGLLSVILISILFPYVEKKITRHNIRVRMSKERYILHYQPIYNPKMNLVVGFEGLLRLLDKNNKLIPPLKFIKAIEESDMLFEISIWIIKKAIKDYEALKNHFNLHKSNFYVSVNISLKEIENDEFVNEAISILKESGLGEKKICLEIIERFKMNDEGKISENIKRLKQAGFKIAIDDFGVEYSNLDIFQKLDVDTIKVDKMLVDGIGKDAVKEEIIFFISKLANMGNRSIVLEGVEEASQDAEIKKIENDKLYVQGYYYNKPMSIEKDSNKQQ